MERTRGGTPRKRRRASAKRSSHHSPDPIEILTREHEQGLYLIHQLTEASRSIKDEGFSREAYRQISEAVRLIDTEVRRHCEKEDQFLVPLLARHAVGPTQILRFEHRELLGAFDQLARIVGDVADGNIKGSSIVELVQSSRTVADLLSDHIEKENTTIFPMTRELLTPEEYNQLRIAVSGARSGS